MEHCWLEENTFREVFTLLYRQCVCVSFNVVKDKMLSEDISTDCFSKLWEKRNTIPDFSRAKAFLMISVLNQSRNYYRHQQVVINSIPELERISENYEQDGLCKLIHSELINRLYLAIQRLPIKQREVVVAYFMYDLDNRTIADTMGIAKNTVKEQKRKGIQFLRAALGSTYVRQQNHANI